MKQPIHMQYTKAIDYLEIVRDNLTHGHKDHEDNFEDVSATIREMEDAISFLKIGMIGGFSALVERVRAWGVERNITGPHAKATVRSQFSKLLEEVDEVCEGIRKNDQHEILDGVGDCTVVLILLSELAGFKFETALLAAYDVIKSRSGRMENGVFIKDQPCKTD